MGLKAVVSGGAVDIQALLDGISSTQGEILYRNASEWVALGVGTAGQVLNTNGAGANPTWEDAAGGSIEKLAALTANGTSASLDFTSVIDSTKYSGYFMTVSNLTCSASEILRMRVSTDNGSTWITTSSYRSRYISPFNFTTSSAASTVTALATSSALSQSATTAGRHGLIELGDLSQAGSPINSRLCTANLSAGEVNSYSPAGNVNAIQVLVLSGNLNAGTVTLYGIKK